MCVQAPRASRELPRPVALVARAALAALDQVLGLDRHRPPVGVGLRAEDDPESVGDVDPLVAVGRPGIGTLGAGYEVREARAGRGPEPERAVDVQPGACG